MAEDPAQNDPVSDPLDDSGADIDALLRGAAELAAGLEEELGRSADAQVETKPAEPSPVNASSADDDAAGPDTTEHGESTDNGAAATPIDDQLEQIDSLLDRASQELGPGLATEAAPDQANDAAPEAPVDAAEHGDVGDPPAAHAPPLPNPFADLSDIGSLPDLDDLPDLDPPNTAVTAQASDHATQDQAAEPANRPSGTVWAAAHRAVDLLDLLDKPLGWLSYEVRVAIGWLALVILLGAAFVTVISLLG